MRAIRVRDTWIGRGLPKIACPVMTSDLNEAEELVRKAAEEGADLIELRADPLAGSGRGEELSECLFRVRREAGNLPVLFTVRSGEEGGAYPIGDPEMKEAVRCALDSGQVDMIDLELMRETTPELLKAAKKTGVPVIISNHDFSATPSIRDMRDRLSAMEKMGADIAKISFMPQCEADLLRLLAVSAWAGENLGIPHIAVSMGETGRPSRELCGLFSSSVTFAQVGGRGSAPGQIELSALSKTLLCRNPSFDDRKFLFLTGFMGSGKSTAARALGDRYHIPVIEMDTEIESLAGKRIPQIWEEDGEDVFRDLETQFLVSLYKRNPAVVSCGGGSVLRPENAALMHRLGRVIFLDVTWETILKRLGRSSPDRPLYGQSADEERVADLLKKRLPVYKAAADAVIPADELTPSDVADAIATSIQKLGVAVPSDLL